MAIFTKGKSDLIRSNRLTIETFETNGAAEWQDTLEVSEADDGDIKILTTRNYRVVKKDSDNPLKEVWASEIEISRKQAQILVDYLISVLK